MTERGPLLVMKRLMILSGEHVLRVQERAMCLLKPEANECLQVS